MPKTPDFTQVAFRVVQQATGQAPKTAPLPKQKDAQPAKKAAAKKTAKKL